MKLYGGWHGPGPRRVAVYLALKGITDIEVVHTVPYSGTRTPEFLAKNPSGKIPALETDDGDVVFESHVILQYLEELYPTPSLHWDDEAGRRRMDVQTTLINEHFFYTYMSTLHTLPYASKGLKQAHDIDMASGPMWRARLDQIAEVMGADKFLTGDKPTIADVMLFPMLEYLRLRFGICLPPHLKTLEAWYDRCFALPGVTTLQLPENFWADSIARFGSRY